MPLHDIPVRPDYIQAGVKPGDNVEIITRNGEKRTFEVTDVTVNAVLGDTERVLISDMQSIGVRSLKEPEHPCGGGMPVGCSVPQVVLLLSEDFKRQSGKFHPACVQHDFCYRHGYTTYGISREECDTTFYDDMRDACGGNLLDVIDTTELAMCELAANQSYEAVRRHGDQHYHRSTSTYCEYRP